MTTSPRFIDSLQGGMLRMKDMVRLTSLLLVRTIKRQVKSGKFLPPVSLGGGRLVGRSHEVYEKCRLSLRQYSND